MCQLRRVMKKLTHLCSRQEPEEEGEGKGEESRKRRNLTMRSLPMLSRMDSTID